MGLFGGGNTKVKQNVTNKTDTRAPSVAVRGDGIGIATAAGGTVRVTTSDPAVTTAALASIENVASLAIRQQARISHALIDSATEGQQQVLDTIRDRDQQFLSAVQDARAPEVAAIQKALQTLVFGAVVVAGAYLWRRA